jgi:hypothetical protein
MKDEALKLALEALELANYKVADYCNGYTIEEVDDAITAIKQALAAPVQEPVAWIHVDAYQPSNRHLEWKENCKGYEGDWVKHPLYTTPPAAPDLQAELDATNRQVEILSDALAESRREIDALVALARADEREACLSVIKPNATPMEIADAIRVRSEK